jgi:hypothetical protein
MIDENHPLVENKPILSMKKTNKIMMGVKTMYPYETYKKNDTRGKYLFVLMLLMGLTFFTGNSVMAVPADTIEVVAKHPESGKSSIYQINFVISKPIPPKAIIRVIFPAEFDLSDLMIAGSTTINGGFDLEVDRQMVIMKRSGLGREISANEKVDVKFAIVKNPNQPGDNYKIEIEILDNEEINIIKQQKVQKILSAKK